MPTWKDNWKPDSFLEIVKQNQSIQAHTLLLVDIALDLEKTKSQLKEYLKIHANISPWYPELEQKSELVYNDLLKLKK